MATAGGWYEDPLRPGRLRYWDGAAWTEHVSEGGAVAQDPIAGVPPAPPPAGAGTPPPAPAAGRRWAVAGRSPYPTTMVGRAGFAVAAIGGVLAAATAGATAVEQEPIRIEITGGAWLGVVAAVLCVAAAMSPFAWGRVAGAGVVTLFGVILAFAVIGLRTSNDLVPGIDVSLATAGWQLFFGSLVLLAGTGIALWGLRVPVTAPDPAAQPKEGKAVASLVLGIVGVLVPVLAGPAIALGLYAIDDERATEGRVGRRGMAVAGIVLGIVSLALWSLGLILGMLLAQP